MELYIRKQLLAHVASLAGLASLAGPLPAGRYMDLGNVPVGSGNPIYTKLVITRGNNTV